MALPNGLPQISDIGSLQSSLGYNFADVSSTMSVPHTSITNRANIPTLTNDLRASLGIDRIAIPQIQEIQDEFGSDGQRVWGAVNDDRGLIRFVGPNWSNSAGAFGAGALLNSGSTVTGSDYIEITFFGTALNLIFNLSNYTTFDMRVSVDGAGEGANIAPVSSSNILAGRNYNNNTVLNLASQLALGVHTVKVRILAATGYGPIFTGFDVINASSQLAVNPGTSWNNGKKVYTALQHMSAYNSNFESGTLGSRGGRVVVYQKADGTIAKAVRAVDLAQANLTSTNHANEEIARVYHLREFGAGRNDDFSTSPSALTNRSFTLDDGTTTLIMYNGYLTNNPSTTEAVWPEGAGGFVTFTFIGTGLDVEETMDGQATRDSAVSVDGISIGTISRTGANSGKKVTKIVSGLPYGAHTVRFAKSGAFNTMLTRFFVYQPKKPTIPAEALELADYNIIADYIATTASVQVTPPQGVLRKAVGARESVICGTWNAIVQGVTDTGSGLNNNTNTAGSYFEYTFFGTGFDYRRYLGATAYNFTITIDGSSNLSAYTTSLDDGALTGLTFNAATGTVSGTGAGTAQPGSIVSVRNIPLGVHTVRFTYNSGHNLYADVLDIITPVHSYKDSGPFITQNALTIGSQGVSDNRKLLSKKDVKCTSQVIGTVSGITTSSTVMSIMQDMIAIHNNKTGKIKISGSVYWSTTNAAPAFAFFVNGVQVSPQYNTNGIAGTFSADLGVNVGRGTHVIAVHWTLGAGTATAILVGRSLTVEEVE